MGGCPPRAASSFDVASAPQPSRRRASPQASRRHHLPLFRPLLRRFDPASAALSSSSRCRTSPPSLRRQSVAGACRPRGDPSRRRWASFGHQLHLFEGVTAGGEHTHEVPSPLSVPQRYRSRRPWSSAAPTRASPGLLVSTPTSSRLLSPTCWKPRPPRPACLRQSDPRCSPDSLPFVPSRPTLGVVVPAPDPACFSACAFAAVAVAPVPLPL